MKGKIKLKLNIVGYGSQLLKIQEYIENNNLKGLVQLHTNVSNTLKFYKEADLFILSSIYEGFPNVLVEAAQNDIPIISTNCNSGPREILLNGRGGELVNIKDHLKISQKIKQFSKNKKNFIKKSQFCKKKLYRFNNKYNLSKFESLFDKL